MGRRRWRTRRPLTEKTVRKVLGLLAAVVLLGVCGGGYRELLELAAVYGENRCRNLVTQAVLDAASETKTDEKLSTFTEADGKSLIALNSDAVRQYQAAVGGRLTQKLETMGAQSHPVPVGTLLGGVLLMERGPRIPIRFLPVGSVRTSVDSTLEDAGVNQVLYRVVLTLSVDMTVVAPGGTRQIDCSQQVILEEVLLTGQVPWVYGG